MCLIIHRPAGKKLDKEVYEEGFRANADGAGIAYIEGNELIVDKGWFKFDEFYKDLLALGDREMVIHFRNASVGMEISADQCHPFEFDTGDVFETEIDGKKVPRYQFAVVHNGKLEWRHTDKMSDTACFVADILEPMLERDPYFLEYDYGKAVLKKVVGEGNKLVIMRHDVEEKKTTIYKINENGTLAGRIGHEKFGCWFSNHSYIKATHPYRSAGYGGDWWDEYREDHGVNSAYSEFSVPDKDGWKWSYHMDCWFNVRTQLMADTLPSRPIRPSYMYGKGGKKINLNERKDTYDLYHLPLVDQKVIQRVAATYDKIINGEKSRTSNKDALLVLRADVRLAFPVETSKLSTEKLDSWIVDKELHTPGNGVNWLFDEQKALALPEGK